ncbi:MAG TPA: hypothetical protein VKY36_07180 [Moheibacter sp.]|nr:hypothetical protein [Moheibacter sp.]
MESTYIELQGNLTQEQLKMAVGVLSAIGLNPIVKGSMIELEDWEKMFWNKELKVRTKEIFYQAKKFIKN